MHIQIFKILVPIEIQTLILLLIFLSILPLHYTCEGRCFDSI